MTPKVIYERSTTVPKGVVIRTDPPAGTTPVDPDAQITVYVSSGPSLNQVLTRFASQANQDAVTTGITNNAVVMSVFAFLDIESDSIRVCDSGCNHKWGGHEWLGVGSFGSIEGISESLELITSPVTLSLSGVDEDYIAAAMSSNYRGRDAVVYLGFFHTDTLALIDTPEEIWSGHMDTMTVESDQGTCMIKITCEHRLRFAPVTARYTDQDQRMTHPLDVFFNKLHLVSTYVGRWGGQARVGNSGGGGGRNQHPQHRPH